MTGARTGARKPATSLALAAKSRSHLDEGASIAIHCRNGIGPASTLAAILPVLEGTEPRPGSHRALVEVLPGADAPDGAACLYRLQSQNGERHACRTLAQRHPGARASAVTESERS